MWTEGHRQRACGRGTEGAKCTVPLTRGLCRLLVVQVPDPRCRRCLVRRSFPGYSCVWPPHAATTTTRVYIGENADPDDLMLWTGRFRGYLDRGRRCEAEFDDLSAEEAIAWGRERCAVVLIRVGDGDYYSAGELNPDPDELPQWPPEGLRLERRRVRGFEALDNTEDDPPVLWDVRIGATGICSTFQARAVRTIRRGLPSPAGCSRPWVRHHLLTASGLRIASSEIASRCLARPRRRDPPSRKLPCRRVGARRASGERAGAAAGRAAACGCGDGDDDRPDGRSGRGYERGSVRRTAAAAGCRWACAGAAAVTGRAARRPDHHGESRAAARRWRRARRRSPARPLRRTGRRTALPVTHANPSPQRYTPSGAGERLCSRPKRWRTPVARRPRREGPGARRVQCS